MRIIIAILVFVVSAYSTNWYVDSNASGSNNGTSWGNAWESFGDIIWGGAGVSAGDILFISGGIDSTTYTETFQPTASGSSGSPIVIKTGQSSPHNGKVIIEDASDDYGIIIRGLSYVTIDGQLGSGLTPNMVIRGHGNDEIRLDDIEGDVILGYLEVGPNTNDEAIYVLNNYMDGIGNRIHHCKIHDFYDYGILIHPPDDSPSNDDHLRIDHNEIYNLGHDGIHAGAGSGGLTIDHNEIHTQLTGPNYNSIYADGMHLRGFNYLTVAYNKIYDIEGADGMYSYIYLECDNNQSNVAANDIYIYNNLIYETDITHGTTSHTGISYGPKRCISQRDVYIVNNTLVDLAGRGIDFGTYEASATNCVVANNIIYNCSRVREGSGRLVVLLHHLDHIPTPTTGSFGSGTDIIWDHNIVDIFSSGYMRGNFGTGSGTQYDYATWKELSKCDNNSLTIDPNFTNWSENNPIDLSLRVGSAGVDDGITQTFFSDDYIGTSRPQGSAWDIGAYECIKNTGNVPNAPSGLRINK